MSNQEIVPESQLTCDCCSWALRSAFLLDNLSPSCSALAGSSTVVLDTPLDAPVEDVVVLVSFVDEGIPEELPQVGVVRLVVEPQGLSIVQEDGELVGEATKEKIGGRGHLLLYDPIILLLLGSGLESLPEPQRKYMRT